MKIRYRVLSGEGRQLWRLYLRRRCGRPAVGLETDWPAARAHYLRDVDSRPVAIDLQPAAVGRFGRGGFCEVDRDRMPGLYEFCPPDEVFAEGARAAVVLLDLPPALPVAIQVDLVGYDPYDAFALRLANFVRSTCHEHLSSVLQRAMPPAILPMVELLLDKNQSWK